MSAWMRLSSGKYVDLMTFNEYDIDLYDIVTSLSNIRRCNGHGQRVPPLSVLQHSCLVYDLACEAGMGPTIRYACLVHDCHESIVGDFTSPNKVLNGYDEPEHIVRAFRRYFGLDQVWPSIHKAVKRYDLQALEVESKAQWHPVDYDDSMFWPERTLGISDEAALTKHKLYLQFDELDFHHRLRHVRQQWGKQC